MGLWGGLALISACTTLPTVKLTPELERLWRTQRDSAAQVQTWTLTGRLSIQTPGEGWHASFQWRQEGEVYQIALSAPLGQQSAKLRGDAQGVILEVADGRRVTAADPEALLWRELGWRVPVNGLYYWVRGLPLPDAAERHGLDEHGRLQWLRQAGWDISYRRYGDFSGQTLPSKIFLDNDEFKVRLVVDGWTL